MSNNTSPVNSGNIENFIISSNTGGGSVDITGGIADFRYYESVLSNSITATVTVVETGTGTNGGVVDSLPVRGGERTDITVTDAQGNQLKFKDGLYVNRVRNSDPTTTRDLYFIDLTSSDTFANDQTRVVKRYEGKISDHVSSILSDVLKTKYTLDVETTSVPYNFFGNDRKPFYICTWLASKSIPSGSGSLSSGGGGSSIGGAAGFLFFQTRDAFVFKSIDSLLSGPPTKKFINTRTPKIPDGYDANILSYTLDTDIDLAQNLSLGTYNNRTIFYDPVSFNYVVRDYNINNQKGKISPAGRSGKTTGELVSPQFTAGPSRLLSTVLDVGYNPSGSNAQEQLETWNSDKTKPNFDSPQTMVQSVMRYNQLFTIQNQITIPGDFTIKAGDIVKCDFPETNSDENAGINSQSSGKYLVAHVCHRITSTDTFTSLGLIRDSYGRSSNS